MRISDVISDVCSSDLAPTRKSDCPRPRFGEMPAFAPAISPRISRHWRQPMTRLLLGRLGRMVPLLLLITLGAFSLVLLLPGDPAVTLAGDNPTPDQIGRAHV